MWFSFMFNFFNLSIKFYKRILKNMWFGFSVFIEPTSSTCLKSCGRWIRTQPQGPPQENVPPEVLSPDSWRHLQETLLKMSAFLLPKKPNKKIEFLVTSCQSMNDKIQSRNTYLCNKVSDVVPDRKIEFTRITLNATTTFRDLIWEHRNFERELFLENAMILFYAKPNIIFLRTRLVSFPATK